MAAGAKPALDPTINTTTQGVEASGSKPATLVEKIIRQLTKIFEHNERLGTTRE